MVNYSIDTLITEFNNFQLQTYSILIRILQFSRYDLQLLYDIALPKGLTSPLFTTLSTLS